MRDVIASGFHRHMLSLDQEMCAAYSEEASDGTSPSSAACSVAVMPMIESVIAASSETAMGSISHADPVVNTCGQTLWS